MEAAAITGLALVAAGAYQAVALLRRNVPAKSFPALETVRRISLGLAFLASGAWLLFAAFNAHSLTLILVAPAVLALSVISLTVCTGIARVTSIFPAPTIRDALRRWLSAKRDAITDVLSNFWSHYAPKETGWGEISPTLKALEDLMEARFIARSHLFLLITLPLFAAASVVVSTRSAMPVVTQAYTAIAGYNALLIASLTTSAAILTIACFRIFRAINVLHFDIDVLTQLRKLATFIGHGTAVGAITAALAPLLQVVIPSTNSSGAAVGAISPSLLIELPAGGAVGGYIIGLLAVILSLNVKANNLFYRRAVTPILFGLISAALINVGFSPASIVSRTAKAAELESPEASTVCTKLFSDEMLNNERLTAYELVQFVNGCEGSLILPDRAVLGILVAVLVVGIVFSTWRDLKSRAATA